MHLALVNIPRFWYKIFYEQPCIKHQALNLGSRMIPNAEQFNITKDMMDILSYSAIDSH